MAVVSPVDFPFKKRIQGSELKIKYQSLFGQVALKVCQVIQL